jgi:glutaredoxin
MGNGEDDRPLPSARLILLRQVGKLLLQRGVAYAERDISRDPQALAELSELGYMTTPVTKINGDVVMGFNQQRLVALLG